MNYLNMKVKMIQNEIKEIYERSPPDCLLIRCDL